MKRMTGIDASFLYMESPSLPMHTLKLGVLDLGAAGGLRFERVLESLRAHMHLLPRLRRRALAVPFGIHHPLWVEDPGFDVAAHVHRVTLPAPGGDLELDALVARVAEEPLDRARPLWQLYVVEGVTLPEGPGPYVAFIAKVHHTVADGMASVEMLRRAMLALTEDGADRDPPGPLPSRAALARAALGEHLGQLRGLPALIAHTMRAGLQARRVTRAALVRPPTPFTGRRTVFNAAISPRRSFTRAELALPVVRQIKALLACTLNDVVLALVAGAVRAYLMARGEPVDEPLTASIPASTSDGSKPGGNEVGSMFTRLHIEVADPIARLRAIQRVTDAAKERHATLGGDLYARWLEFTREAPHRLLWHRIVPRLARPPVHLVVSNVPGPREPLVIEGARLVRLASAGPLLAGVGLNVTVWSYLDTLCFSVLACAEAMPDPPVFAAGLRAALEELHAAALAMEPPTPSAQPEETPTGEPSARRLASS